MDKVVFDAFGILTLLQKEKGYEIVKDYLERSAKGEIRAYMNLINWGEVCYMLIKRGKTIDAEELWEGRKGYPILFADSTPTRIKSASKIKGNYPVSYADAFCIALSVELKAKVITGDKEFSTVSDLEIVWIG
ncbi:MAG: type II toxin-antitoxin system VapC family toxin [Thermodesulfobacteriota bacterium]